MAFSKVSWEISTGDPGRAAQIANAVDNALAAFPDTARLLNHTVLLSGREDIDQVRGTLDAVAAQFPAEFFYTSATFQGSQGDLQGAYPPSADLDTAHRFTGDSRNPFQRGALAIAGGATRGRTAAASRRRPAPPAAPPVAEQPARRGRKKKAKKKKTARRVRTTRPKRGTR
jgi:hypothetical protein